MPGGGERGALSAGREGIAQTTIFRHFHDIIPRMPGIGCATHRQAERSPLARTQLSHVHIANFRSIRELDLDIPPFAVLVGPNGSGKTNFVQALTLLGDVLQHGSTDPVEALGWESVVRRAKKRAHHIVLGAQVIIPKTRIIVHPDRPEVRPEVTVDVELDLKPASQGAVRVERELLRLASGGSTLEVIVRNDEVKVRSDGPSDLAG